MPEKLAPGHRLPHDQVAESQRERLIAAITDLAHERGYCDTTVSDVLRRAAVSRASFYQLFSNREHCALAAFDVHVARLQAEAISAYRSRDLDSQQSLRAALDRVLHAVISWPAAARLWSSEISTVGGAGLTRRERVANTAANALAGALAEISGAAPRPTVARAMVGAINRLIYTRVRDGHELELPGMVDELLAWMLSYRSTGFAEREWSGRRGSTATGNPLPSTLTSDRDDKAATIRERIVTAVADLASKQGYQAMTYRDIATAAQISLTTFYNNFANKQEAFLAAFDVTSDRLTDVVVQVFQTTSEPARALSDSVTALVNEFNVDQTKLRLAFIELPSTGRPGLQRLDRVLQAAQDGLRESFGPRVERCDAAHEIAVGAISEILVSHTVTGRLAELPRMAPELSYIALTPLVGTDAALEVRTEPA